MVKNQCSYSLCALCNLLHRSLEVILSSSLVCSAVVIIINLCSNLFRTPIVCWNVKTYLN
ncbi:hypothetical protein Hanom_Chr04g00303521 [Helianthus anomalus]